MLVVGVAFRLFKRRKKGWIDDALASSKLLIKNVFSFPKRADDVTKHEERNWRHISAEARSFSLLTMQ